MAQQREVIAKQFEELLVNAVNSNTIFKDIIENEPFKSCPFDDNFRISDAEIVFRKYRDAMRKNEELKKSQLRDEIRNNFETLLDECKFTPISLYSDFKNQYQNDPRFQRILSREYDGLAPDILFRRRLQNLVEDFRIDSDIIRPFVRVYIFLFSNFNF